MRIDRTPPDLDVRFGILKSVRKTPEGVYLKGKYKDYDIDIYQNNLINANLVYVSKFGKWLKSKLRYGNQVIRSEQNAKKMDFKTSG